MKKVILIGLALVLALGTLGAAFAAWTDQVTITEEINTGEVLVGILDTGTDDSGPLPIPGDPATYLTPPFDPGWQNGPVMYDKNVAQCISENFDEVYDKDGRPTGYYKRIVETINNGYPSYAPTVFIELANLGTIPVILYRIVQEPVIDPDGLAPFVVLVNWIVRFDGVEMATGATWDDLNNYLGSGELQIEPGVVVGLELTKHIEQEDLAGNVCPENASVTMSETLHFIQWNEAP